MYLWMKDEFGEKSGFAAAIFYLFAPYHLIDLHFRASVAELIAMAILPFLFLTTKRFVESSRFMMFFYTSILFSALIITHQVAALASLPLVIVYGFSVWVRNKKRNLKILFLMLFSYLSGTLLMTFYWLPVLAESKYVLYGRIAEIYFHPLSDFFYSPNKFGLLFQGHYGELYTSVGYTQWVIVVLGLYIILKKKAQGKEKHMLTGSLIIFAILFLMMQSFSKPLWDVIPIIKNFQFS